ncbi:hypothetical protein [Janthinobacterium sp. AD80]|uniref:hypothetical protein n=1 Tax=Janthinobacterium sp. AD80 TaxID=1528773 RepID=UPI0011AF8FF4|nr:hypothetical protein [Janthinobacterium sp. AD80]
MASLASRWRRASATGSSQADGAIACVTEQTWMDGAGRQLARVSMHAPWGVASVAGISIFSVLAAQLARQ